MIEEILIGILMLIVVIYFMKAYFTRKINYIKSIEGVLSINNPKVIMNDKVGNEVTYDINKTLNTLLREKEAKEKAKALTKPKAGLWAKLKLLFKKNKQEVKKEDDIIADKPQEDTSDTSNAVVSS